MEQIEIIKQMSSSMLDVCSRWCDKCQKHRYHRYNGRKYTEDGINYIEKSVECFKCKTVTHIGIEEIR